MALSVEQTKMNAIDQRMIRLNSLLQSLDSDFRNSVASGPASVAGADQRWRQWAYDRRMVLNTEIAQVRALKAAQLSAVRTAFGRNEATRQLMIKTTTALKTKIARMSD
ncbi:hypothetical protein [Yoonia sp. 208BN28-4]|uniref:hypothetical protein n=1 Tax=Yoonia sp. 208BN28-4 TaxID=3126505 RepID=UPI0030B3A946